MSEDFYLFWGGPFSQWAKFPIKVDGIKYNCCEQHMMAEKARLFGDAEMLKKIMAEKDPRKQKAYGRKIKNFNKDTWEVIARDVVYKSNYAKFTQNPECLMELYNSRGKTVVEASPHDCIWGIGLAEDDPRALDRSQWKGTNWLGEAIMQAREKMEEDGAFDAFDELEEE